MIIPKAALRIGAIKITRGEICAEVLQIMRNSLDTANLVIRGQDLSIAEYRVKEKIFEAQLKAKEIELSLQKKMTRRQKVRTWIVAIGGGAIVGVLVSMTR